MATEQHHGAVSLIKGELHQSLNESWHVSVRLSDTDTPVQPNEQGDEINLQSEEMMHMAAEAEPTAAAVDGDTTSESSARSKEIINFLKDDKKEMTYGRRIALSLINNRFYNPQARKADLDDSNGNVNENDQVKRTDRKTSYIPDTKEDDFDAALKSGVEPNLKMSWAYFEHVALYRYLVPPEESSKGPKKNILVRAFRKAFLKWNKKMERAEAGESDTPTRLYSPIFTPHSQLGDFGLGIGLYFSTLRAITFITFLAGLASVYNIIYFASNEYQPEEFTHDLSTFERGSAICTYTSWVPCVDCDCVGDDQDARYTIFPADRCAKDPNYPDLTFVLHNECDGTKLQVVACNYAALIVVSVAVFFLGRYLKREELRFDIDEQTAQDYSVMISNPPRDAKSPDEWHQFFKDNFDGAHATVVTCAVDNDILVKTMVERRECLRKICNIQEAGSSMKLLDLARVAVEEERGRNFISRFLAKIIPGVPELLARVVALNTKVEGLAQLDFPVTNVFVTFETEKDQRSVLSALSVGAISVSRNDINAVLDPKYLFRGRHVLKMKEADEPNTIRWADLNASHFQRFKERLFTFLCTIVAIILVAVIVALVNDASTLGCAFTISAFNVLFPLMAKMLTYLESHPSESSKQTSLYYKICLFRWVSTAVVISLITPFTNTLASNTGLVTQVLALFWADIVTTNALQLMDPAGHLQRHYLAPRAVTQDAMNLCFQGTMYELAERYTDMTKILFLCLWYSSIFPGSFFFCSFSLGIKYFVDRFSLMRTWKRAPNLGTSISRSNRRVFFPIAIVAMAIREYSSLVVAINYAGALAVLFLFVVSSYFWTGFPYDNICPNDGIDEVYLNKSFRLTSSVSVTFTQNDVDYRFCNMNMMTLAGGFTFPFVPTASSEETNPKEWMTEEQMMTTLVYGWSAIAILGVVLLWFLVRLRRTLMDRFRSTYKTVGKDQGIAYSEVTSRTAYIPQVASPLFSYPLIACNTDNVDPELYDWMDPERTFRFYDLTKDAKKLLAALDIEEPPGFSLVKHFPPKKEE